MSAPYSVSGKSGAGAGSTGRVLPNSAILDKPLSKGKAEINISTFALLFSEMVQVRGPRCYSGVKEFSAS